MEPDELGQRVERANARVRNATVVALALVVALSLFSSTALLYVAAGSRRELSILERSTGPEAQEESRQRLEAALQRLEVGRRCDLQEVLDLLHDAGITPPVELSTAPGRRCPPPKEMP